MVDPKYGKRIDYKIGENITPFDYTDIFGNKISSELLKGKVIVLNFWSPSCGPCIKEIPDLNKLVDKLKNKEVVFIGPAIYTTKENVIKNFLPQHPFKYKIVLINQDDYAITSFPTNIIIDQNHKVIEKISGYLPENIELLEKKINEILK